MTVCQQSYIYDYVIHAVTMLNDTLNVTLGPTEMLVMANNPQNPYWNSSCTDCNGIVNGSSMMDDCGVCQQSYIYDYVTQAVTMLDDTLNVTLGPTEMIVMANDPQNPYWNSYPIISYDTIVSNNSITWNGIYLTSSGDYHDSTLISINGCDSIANLNFTYNNSTSIDNLEINNPVIKVTDLLGRDSKTIKNQVLIYIYKDGTRVKRIFIQ